MKEITKLDVYVLSEKLSDVIWDVCIEWNRLAQHTIGYQIFRSADSIAANIAEGYGRYSYADRKRFYYFARTSFEETKTWLRKATRRNLIPTDTKEILISLSNELGPKLNAFIRNTHA